MGYIMLQVPLLGIKQEWHQDKDNTVPLKKEGGTGRKEERRVIPAERRDGGGLLKFDS